MTLPAWAPTADDVAALLRSRTLDSQGNELGAFTADTRPTLDQVNSLIETRGVVEVVGLIGDADLEAGSQLDLWAKSLSATRAAIAIERSYNPEQAGQEGSLAAQLAEDYAETWPRFERASRRLIGASAKVGSGGIRSVPVRLPTEQDYIDETPDEVVA